jgi:hypothetical protein
LLRHPRIMFCIPRDSYCKLFGACRGENDWRSKEIDILQNMKKVMT